MATQTGWPLAYLGRMCTECVPEVRVVVPNRFPDVGRSARSAEDIAYDILCQELEEIGKDGWPLGLRWSFDWVDGAQDFVDALRSYADNPAAYPEWRVAVQRAIDRIIARGEELHVM